MAVVDRNLYAPGDINSYFTGCVCSYRGRAQYIEGTDNNTLLLSDGVRVSFHSEDVQFVPVKAGFYQMGHRAFFITRNPIRQWKKAFRPRGWDVYFMGNATRRNNGNAVSPITLYQATLDKEYLSYSDAYSKIASGELDSAALSESIAIGFDRSDHRYYVYARSSQPVRIGLPSSSGVVLFSQSSEFKETLEQSGVPINEN